MLGRRRCLAGIRATMRFAKLTAATLITVGLTLAPRIGIADPTDDDTAEAQLDPDYAAGKKAIEAKNWSGAIKSLSSAALRDPRECRYSDTDRGVTPTVTPGRWNSPSSTTEARCS